MFYESSNCLELENAVARFREHTVRKLELSSSVATYCHGEDDHTSAMTTKTATTTTTSSMKQVNRPKPAPRRINDITSYVCLTSQHHIPPTASSIYQHHPNLQSTKLETATTATNILMKTNHCDNPPDSTLSYRQFIDKTHLQQKQANGQLAIVQQQHISLQDENYEGSSSTDDTEDSTDKNSKPKPGKLDLRQFDNITNAIGKLNVQSKKTSPESNVGLSKSSKHQAAPSETESGYFKSRSKKVRSKVKESPAKEEIAASSSTKLKKPSSSASYSKQSPSAIESRPPANIADAIGERSQSSSTTDRDIETSDISIAARSSRFQSETDQQIRTPTFSGPAKSASNLDTQDLPRPAPRSSQSAQSSTSPRAPTVSVASTKTSPSTTSAITSSTSTSASNKPRLTNMRQNHGRAVAPPQLPGGHMSSALSSEVRAHESDASRLNDKPSSYQSKAEELGVDFSQSPIAQRLLKYSKDYKVSELNSPGESDSEQTPTLTSFRNKLQKGPSLDSGKASPHALFPNASIDSSELINAKGAAIKQLNEILANKQPHGRFAGARPPSHSRGSSFDQEQEPSSQTESAKKKEKDSKKDKKKLRDDEKSEKKRQKEEERLRRQEKKLAAKKLKAGDISGNIDEDGIPLFIRRCIEFIEYEGLDAEGIYRVPGNRAHVDAFVQKFKDNPDMSIVESDIPVNAVATALKDFLSKKWGPIIPLDLMNELTALSSISDKNDRMEAVRHLVRKLPQSNYNLLKYVFGHFVKVSLNHSLNSMDSKNLAICWWPTLLPLHFSDMVMFEQMRPHLEESVQTMIDQYDYIFEDDISSASPAFKSATTTNS